MKNSNLLFVLVLFLQCACSRNDSTSSQFAPTSSEQTPSSQVPTAPVEITLPSDQEYQKPICGHQTVRDPITNVKRQVVIYCN